MYVVALALSGSISSHSRLARSLVAYFTPGGVEARLDATPRMLTDMEASSTLPTGLTLAGGAQNLDDICPTPATGASGTTYPEYSPFSFNGDFYYFRALYGF